MYARQWAAALQAQCSRFAGADVAFTISHAEASGSSLASSDCTDCTASWASAASAASA
eukprot:CAMPEP_0170638078 /NCGR_PEP_ID=MMETSP0224-20130122/38809_1 /TAXON_ID=285029 /ORGANISM="Togula jolla, Strain CCCM 725" /LENGTH=57 /DNA_ID=CAMNT_0010968113 /DNA_START=94 /DNA_END=263 /DNA_ORIENTATION=+